MNAVRRLVDFAGPAIWVVMLGLAIWVLIASDGDIAFEFSTKQVDFGGMTYGFFASISLTVAYFSTLMLN